MRYGVRLPNSGPFASREAIEAMATAADRLGYDHVTVHDHVTWTYGDRYHFYAGSREQADALERPTDFYGAMTTLGYLAGITQRVRLIPYALCLSWRPALILAREALTLHRLSGERFVLAVCLGDARFGDYAVTGTPWEERGRIVNEKLQVLRMVIDQPGPISFDGKYVRFEDAELNPRPEGLPIWYAGASDIALKRAARYAEGWMPSGNPEFFSRKLPELHREAERVGRGDVEFEIGTAPRTCVASTDDEAWDIALKTVEAHTQGEWMQLFDSSGHRSHQHEFVGSPETVAGVVRNYASAGVTTLGLGFIGHSVESLVEQMEMFSSEVIPLVP